MQTLLNLEVSDVEEKRGGSILQSVSGSTLAMVTYLNIVEYGIASRQRSE